MVGPLFAVRRQETWAGRSRQLYAINSYLPLYISLWLISISTVFCPGAGKVFSFPSYTSLPTPLFLSILLVPWGLPLQRRIEKNPAGGPERSDLSASASLVLSTPRRSCVPREERGKAEHSTRASRQPAALWRGSFWELSLPIGRELGKLIGLQSSWVRFLKFGDHCDV